MKKKIDWTVVLLVGLIAIGVVIIIQRYLFAQQVANQIEAIIPDDLIYNP